MKDESIHILIDGDDLVIAIGATRKWSGQSPLRVNGRTLLAALFAATEAELAMTASGQMTMAMDGIGYGLDGDNECPFGDILPIRAQSLDELVRTMTERLLAAPDCDDAEALDECVARLGAAKTIAARARRRLRAG